MSGSSESAPVERARTALEQGQAWRARDTLVTLLETQRDPAALALLGEVLHEMGDLPAAGAAWFAAGAKGPQAEAAVAAWRERSHDDFAVMWRSLPASVRADPQSPRLEALRDRARVIDASIDEPATEGAPLGSAHADDSEERDDQEDDDEAGGLDAAQFIAWLAAAAFVACGVIGLWTVLQWLVPG